MQNDKGLANLVDDLSVNHKDSTSGRRVKHSRGCNQKSARFLKHFVTGREVGQITSSLAGRWRICNLLPPHTKFTKPIFFIYSIGAHICCRRSIKPYSPCVVSSGVKVGPGSFNAPKVHVPEPYKILGL